MPTFQFKKLIRDKILQKHIDAGHTLVYENLKNSKLKEKLRQKLHEEADEVPILDHATDEVIEEIGDVQQVLDDLKHAYDITDEQVRRVQSSKYDSKGGFIDGVYIQTVTLEEGDEWVNYYRSSPSKYPEVNESTGKVDPIIPDIEKGTYRHAKTGKLYDVIGVSLSTETNEALVIYKPLYETRYELFARPHRMFTEMVEIEGEEVLRFEKVDDKVW